MGSASLTGVAVHIEKAGLRGKGYWLKKQGECWECPTTLPGFNLAPGSAPYRVDDVSDRDRAAANDRARALASRRAVQGRLAMAHAQLAATHQVHRRVSSSRR